mgnify:CR=1 FL=1
MIYEKFWFILKYVKIIDFLIINFHIPKFKKFIEAFVISIFILSTFNPHIGLVLSVLITPTTKLEDLERIWWSTVVLISTSFKIVSKFWRIVPGTLEFLFNKIALLMSFTSSSTVYSVIAPSNIFFIFSSIRETSSF